MLSRGRGFNEPAFEGIHELARGIQTLAHQDCLLAHGNQGILEEAGLILRLRGIGHVALLLCMAQLGDGKHDGQMKGVFCNHAWICCRVSMPQMECKSMEHETELRIGPS